MPKNAPSWLAEPCPPWCTGLHAEDDHPEDRAHRNEGVEVPVVTRRAVVREGGVRPVLGSAEVHIALHSPVGSDEVWVYIGDGSIAGGVEVPIEAARRIAKALAAATG